MNAYKVTKSVKAWAIKLPADKSGDTVDDTYKFFDRGTIVYEIPLPKDCREYIGFTVIMGNPPRYFLEEYLEPVSPLELLALEAE
jgi:hypothetical protein